MATTNVLLLSTQQILNREVNVYGDFENPLFLAKDVAGWIGYTKTVEGAYDIITMLRNVTKQEKMIRKIISTQNQEVWVLTENGLYEILMQHYNYELNKFRIELKKALKSLRYKYMLQGANELIANSIEKEIWRDIPGYEGLYQVSSIGRVRSVNRVIETKHRRKTTFPGKILSISSGRTSLYLAVSLSKNSENKKILVHRLVAMSFLSEWNPNMEVNHIDGNIFNNSLSNLELCTSKANHEHAIVNNLKRDYGQLSSNAKISNLDVYRIRQLRKLGVQQKDLAAIFNLSKQTVSSIVNYKIFKQ